MPLGTPWFTQPPTLFAPPVEPLFRVIELSPDWGPLDGNPMTEARFALTRTHKMFYAADSLEGALWEALLRFTVIQPGGVCHFPVAKLKNKALARVRMVKHDVRVLQISRPGLLLLFPDGDGPVVEHVERLLHTPRHEETHPAARELLEDLGKLTPPILHMPILNWHSRQFPKSQVYLAYDKPVGPSYWELVEDVMPLDTPEGMALIRSTLAKHQFNWTPLSTIPPASMKASAT